MPIYEKRGLAWIDESTLQKNRLFLMYDSRTKDKFLAQLLKDLVVESSEEKKDCELKDAEIDLDNQNKLFVKGNSLAKFIDMFFEKTESDSAFNGENKFLDILTLVEEETLCHPVVFEKLKEIIKKKKIDQVPFQLAVHYLTVTAVAIMVKESKDVCNQLDSFLSEVSELKNAQKKLPEEKTKGKSFEETMKITSNQIDHFRKLQQIGDVKNLGFHKAFEIIEEQLRSSDKNVDACKDHFLDLIKKYDIQDSRAYSTCLDSFKKFPKDYLAINEAILEGNKKRCYQYFLDRYIPYLLDQKEIDSSVIGDFVDLVTDEKEKEKYTQRLKEREKEIIIN